MAHISLWFMVMMLIYWVEEYNTIKKNTEALVVGSKESSLEVNADKTKYMVMSRDKNAGRSHNTMIDNSSIERVEEFKCLGQP
jgi:hypothetical protein